MNNNSVRARVKTGGSARSPSDLVPPSRQSGRGRVEPKLPDRDTLKPFSVETLPSFQADIPDILERRKIESRRRITAREARSLIEVGIGVEGPFGILHFGDPHLDDPGTDVELLLHHMDIVKRTPALYAACLGDFINNWRGKLARLHAEQSTTQLEAIKLLQWFVAEAEMPWVYLIGGNHDVWHGDGDPMIWLRGEAAYEWHQCRLSLVPPSGRTVRINARHNWPGRSIYGPAHGAARGALFDGRDHVYIGGHIHTWEHRTQEGHEGHIWHAVQVASYKRIDDHALSLGFGEKRHGAAVLTVINPHACCDTDLVSVHWGIEAGAQFLTSLRADWRRQAA